MEREREEFLAVVIVSPATMLILAFNCMLFCLTYLKLLDESR